MYILVNCDLFIEELMQDNKQF